MTALLHRGLPVVAGCSATCRLTGRLLLVHRTTRTVARARVSVRGGRTATLRLKVARSDRMRARKPGAKLILAVTARAGAKTVANIRRPLKLAAR